MQELDELIALMVQARKEQNLTQEQLAEIAGISRRSLVAIESGGDCMLSTLRRLFLALDLDLVAKPAEYRPPTLEDIQAENRAQFKSQSMRPKP